MVSLNDIIILYYDERTMFACLYALSPSQQFINCVETISCLLRLNQYIATDKQPCSMIEYSDSTGDESRTSNPSIPNLMLYKLSHFAPPKSYQKTAGIYDTVVLEQQIFNF